LIASSTETSRWASTALHRWWYGCFERAGVVSAGQTRGERMHKARHRLASACWTRRTGNLKAVQKLLGHASISTTADTYVDWDIDQLAETLSSILDAEGER
jgi:integrase